MDNTSSPNSSPSDLTPDKRLSLRDLFLHAARLNSLAEQEQWLVTACPHDPQLRGHVLKMLAAPEPENPSMLDRSLLEANRERDKLLQKGKQSRSGTAGPPGMIGPYRLEEEIGRGGMSIVYRAVQTDPWARQVAVKILYAPIANSLTAIRFKSEQSVLAKLQHHSIATIFDSGTTDNGEPYFVMEYINGVPITEFCQQNCLNLSQRLDATIQVCQAIAHAHQQGIIHRDLKPSNILVVGNREQFQIKIIDFGIAKALDEPAEKASQLTGERQIIGTPLYMSPEQMQPGGPTVDTRSDIYSIGCVLYELLVGHAPFDDSSTEPISFTDLHKRICSQEPPPTPSSLSKRHEKFRNRKNVACSTPIRSGVFGARRDLDWIALKSLDKDKDRRYSSADALADDLRRYLQGAPVLAGPPTFRYAFGKFLARHRALAGLSTLTLLFLVAATLFSWQQMRLARQAAQVADERLALVQSAQLAADRQRQAAEASERTARQAQRNAEFAQRNAELAQQDAETAWRESDRENYLAEIRLASEAARTGELSLAWRLLQNQIPENTTSDWRGIEWWLLHDLLDRNPDWKVAAEQPIIEIAVSSDEKLVAVSTDARAVQIFSITNGELLLSIPTVFRQLGLAWFPEGRQLAMGGVDRQITVGELDFDAENSQWSWEIHHQFRAHTDEVNSLVFTPDGQFLVSGSDDRSIKLWKTTDYQQIAQVEHHERAVEEVAVSSDGPWLASAGSDLQFCLWELPDLRLHASWPMDHRVVTVAFSPDNSSIAAGDISGNVKIVDLQSQKVGIRKTLDGIEKLRYFAHSGKIVMGDRAGKVQWFYVQDEPHQLVLVSGNDQRWSASSDRVKSVATLSDGTLLTAHRDGFLSKWPDHSSNFVLPVRSEKPDVGHLDLLSPQQLMVIHPEVQIWNHQTQAISSWENSPLQKIERFAVSDNGEAIALADDQQVIIYSQIQQRIIDQWPIPQSPHLIGISPDGTRVAVCCGQVRSSALCFQAGEPTAVALLSVRQPDCLQFSQDGQHVAVSRMNDLWVIPWGEERPSLILQGHDSTITGCRSLANPPRILTVSHDRRMNVWDAESGELQESIEAHTDKVRCLALSRDGRRAVTGGNDRTIRLWETDSWRQVLTWPTEDAVGWVAFCQDDQGIVANLENSKVIALRTKVERLNNSEPTD